MSPTYAKKANNLNNAKKTNNLNKYDSLALQLQALSKPTQRTLCSQNEQTFNEKDLVSQVLNHVNLAQKVETTRRKVRIKV